jgi:hypothetical protein
MKKVKTYETILVITTGFVILYLLTKAITFIIVALTISVLSIMSFYIADKINWLWMKLSEGMGYISSKLILSIVFYLLLLPISLIYKIFNKDTLNVRKRNRLSIYVERNHKYNPEEMENVW